MAKNTWVYALKKNVSRVLKSRHSKAGKKELARVKAKKEETKGMSHRTRTQLNSLSDTDRKAVLKAMKGK